MFEKNMISGRHPVEEALTSGRPLKKIWLAGGVNDPFAQKISQLAKKAGVSIQVADRRQLDKLAPGQNHQGIVGIATPFAYVGVDDLLTGAKGEDPFLLVLDKVQDPHNLGALLRTAEAAGVHGVIISEKRSVGVTSGVYKSAAGAVEHVPIARVTNISQTLKYLKDKGMWVIGGDMEGRDTYAQANLKGPLALVLGGEGKGISRLVKENCDFLVHLPMKGKGSSLNVSVAGGLLMYEVFRQRQGW